MVNWSVYREVANGGFNECRQFPTTILPAAKGQRTLKRWHSRMNSAESWPRLGWRHRPRANILCGMRKLLKRPGRKQGDSPPGLPSRLRLARERAGLTITAAAEAIGVHKDTWASWESGVTTRIDFSAGFRACDLLGIDPAWLVNGDDKQSA